MSEVLFGQAYYLRFDAKLWAAMQPYPPLGTLYAAGYLRSRGYDVALFDAMLAESEQAWDQALAREQPRFAVLYEDHFNYLTKMCLLRMREAALTMIEMARTRGCTVIVCSSDASDHAETYLARGAHFILVGEGEETLAELMDRLTGRTDTPFEAIQGLAFPDLLDEHRIIHTPRRNVIKDLDALPRPAWDLADIPRYRDVWYRRHGYFSMNMVTSRGCPFHCNWCAKPIWGQRYHARSPENVAAEMKWLKDTYRPDHLWFMDDMMGIKPGWTARLAMVLEELDVHIPFKCLNRVDLLLRDGEIDALKQAGCRIVWTGVESGSQHILDAMDKGITVEQTREAARRLHDAGMQVGFFIQFGYPGETRDAIEQTFQLVRDCRPDQIGVSVSYPLPGTPFYEAVKAQLGVKQHWIDSDDLAMLYRGPFTTGFYRKLHRVLHKEFRSRQAWHALRSVGRRPATGRNPLREAAALLYHTVTLPFARLHLERLATVPHDGIRPLPRHMTTEEAATPAPFQ
ncbi:MAG: B12-binding domain-containing radical SAM protein [Rhodothermales bacterium]